MSKRQRRMNKKGRRYQRRSVFKGAALAAWGLLGHNAIWDGVKCVAVKVAEPTPAPVEQRFVAANAECSPTITVGFIGIVAEAGSLSIIGG